MGSAVLTRVFNGKVVVMTDTQPDTSLMAKINFTLGPILKFIDLIQFYMIKPFSTTFKA